jgi:hypothetical protein
MLSSKWDSLSLLITSRNKSKNFRNKTNSVFKTLKKHNGKRSMRRKKPTKNNWLNSLLLVWSLREN